MSVSSRMLKYCFEVAIVEVLEGGSRNSNRCFESERTLGSPLVLLVGGGGVDLLVFYCVFKVIKSINQTRRL